MGKQQQNTLVLHFARGLGGQAYVQHELMPKIKPKIEELLQKPINYVVYNYFDPNFNVDLAGLMSYIIILAPRNILTLDAVIHQVSKYNPNILVVLPHEQDEGFPVHDDQSHVLRLA